MLRQTEGIVLKSSTFGEADLIVTYLTRDYGLLKVFAKSPRKTKSRFGSSLEPLTYSKISFFGKEDVNLPRLTQSDIIKTFHVLRDELKCFLSISEILELNIRFLPEKEPNLKAFKLLLNMLMRLESDCSNRLYYLYYKLKFLEITGYSPKFDACGKCGANRNGRHHFYVSYGSIMCEKCIDNKEDFIRITEGTLNFYKGLLKWNLSNINRIRVPEFFVSEMSSVINLHIMYIGGMIRSFDFNQGIKLIRK